MAWELVSKSDVAKNIRVAAPDIQDIWYDSAIGLVERFTGWNLVAAQSYTEYGDGNGSEIFTPEVLPLNSVSSLKISTQLIPSTAYLVRWDGVYFKTPEVLPTTPYTTSLIYYNHFPFGIGNVYIEYNGGGITNLPSKYSSYLPMTLTYIIKELSVLFRNEGSDNVLEKYRPDRSQVKEEVLQNYGIHGKVRGIIKSWYPIKMRVA